MSLEWDFFIAHSSADAECAEELYAHLSEKAKVFLDEKSLLLGDDWDRKLADAQRATLITLVLVSSRTERAYYQREEIAAAVELARHDEYRHRIIPIYLHDEVDIPYGLRLKHGLYLSTHRSLARVAARLLDELPKVKALSEKAAGSSRLPQRPSRLTHNPALTAGLHQPMLAGTPPPLSSQTSVRKFREEYLAADPAAPPVPFGGRDGEMAKLDAWLDGANAPPRLLITAPAGRGKSALLVRWLERLRERGVAAESGPSNAVRWQTVFFPISIRFRTNLPENYLQGIAERLARLAGKTLQPPAIEPVDFYTVQVQDSLQQLDEQKARVLLVLDGLDEALRGEFNPDLFPRRLSGNVRIVVSARLQRGDTDWTGWRDRLGWRSGQPCEHLELDILNASGIRDVLDKLGAPVAGLAVSPSLVRQLVTLTEGDPLVLRYYSEDLWTLAREVGTRITEADLTTLKPGFGEYFNRWLAHQRKAWNEAGDAVDLRAVDALLMALSFAHGPLEATDLVALLRHFPSGREILHIQHVLEPLRRFVIGNGQPEHGYTLSHPKIGEHLKQERFAYATDELQNAFVAWGRETVARVNDDPSQFVRASAYLIQFYRRHLEDIGAPLADFMALVEDGWRRCWQHYEASQQGFACDVAAAWKQARRRGRLAELGAQLRCALTLSSIRSVGTHVPGELLFQCATAGVLTARQAEYLARFISGVEERLVTLCRIAVELVEDPVLRPALLDEVMTAAHAIRAEDCRARALIALAPRLPPELRQDAASVALAAAQTLAKEDDRVDALCRLAPHLPTELLSQALAAAQACQSAYSRHKTLAALAPHLPTELLSQALTAARDSVYMRIILAPHLPPELRQRVLSATLAAALAISSPYSRADALGALAPHLPPELLSRALSAARAIGNDVARARALRGLAPYLPSALLQRAVSEAVAAAEAIGDDRSRVWEMSRLAPYMPPELRQRVLSDALAATEAIGESDSRTANLSLLAPHLPPELLSQALTSTQAIEDEIERALQLSALAPHLPSELLSQALTAVQALRAEDCRTLALNALVLHLSPALLSQALTAAQTVGDNDDRAAALSSLAAHLPELSQQILSEALAAAEAIGDDRYRVWAMSRLAPHLPAALRRRALGGALTAARAIRNDRSRANALCGLAPHLPSDLLSPALTLAEAISEDYYRAQALTALAPHLPSELRERSTTGALDAAQAVHYSESRVGALSRLAPHLPPDLRHRVSKEALTAAYAIDDKDARAEALCGLASHLAPELRQQVSKEALTAAQNIGEDFVRANALGALAPHLPSELLLQALIAAQAIANDAARARALSALAPHLPPARRQQALSEALTAARAISDDSSPAWVLRELAPQLPPEMLPEALGAFLQTSQRMGRRELLSTVPAFAAAIHAQGGGSAVGELRRAILDTARWYP
jgi:hypothetical protein